MTEAGARPSVAIAGENSRLALLAVALFACAVYAAFVGGPAMRISATERLDHAIADENRSFCEKFGMRAGTSEFLACTKELAVIRQNQIDRDHAAEIGLL